MDEEKSDISKLLELKKYEQPEEGFFDDFLQDFRMRQRQEMMNVSARTLFKERMLTFFKERSMWQWGAGAAVACAAVVMAFSLHGGSNVRSEIGAPMISVDLGSSESSKNSNAASETVVVTSKILGDEVLFSGAEQFATFEMSDISEPKAVVAVSPLMVNVDIDYDFIDLNQGKRSNNVEF